MLHTFLTQACRSCVWADWVQFHSVPELGEQMGDLESYFPPISDPVLNPDQHLLFSISSPSFPSFSQANSFLPFPASTGRCLYFNKRDVFFISTEDCYQKFPLGIVTKDECWSEVRRRSGVSFSPSPLPPSCSRRMEAN